MRRLFILLIMVCAITTVFSQNITKAEYFFDTDPGPGNGKSITIPSPAETVNFSENIPTTGLNSGFHLLTMRVYDLNGRWSRSESRGFYIWTQTTNTGNIIAAEYFFDSDPGPGNGIATSIGTAGSVVTFTASIPANLSTGFHFLGIRTKDSDGKWGFFDKRSFYVSGTTPGMPAITAAEYFFDHDPGPGNASSLTLNSPGDIITQTLLVPVPASLSQGDHLLAIRVKDQQGHWSLFEKDTITVGAVSGSITCPGNVTIDPFTNNCKAVVFNIDAVGLPEDDSSYTYTMTGATTGRGIGTASGQLFNPGLTTVTYALINSPTVSCSFTVTVNASVTPTAKISIPNTTICEGTLTSFVCTYTGGGFNTSWQWKKNGIIVGTNSNIYRDSSLENSDTITVAVTSSISCAIPQTVTSVPVVMMVHETVTPSVSIIANATAICPGQLVTFTATPTNGGSQPIYEWMKNGSFVGADTVYQTSALANGDSVYLMLHNTTDCVTNTPVKSNVIHITTTQAVAPSVTINASATTICSGTTVTLNATPADGGANPAYQWKLNGSNVGTNSATYQNSSLQNGDKVKVVMTSSAACASPSSAVSEEITMTVNTAATPSVTIGASAESICNGQSVTFTASPNYGGNNPVYEWTLNNNAVGSNSPIYQTTTLANGDNVRVTMAPSQSCGSNTPVVSNTITMTVGTSVSPSVTMSASTSSICTGSLVIFYASPISGAGNSPSYQWKRNGVNIPGATSSTYQSSSLADGDVIRVEMTSSLSCANPQTVLSHDSATMTISSVALTPSVTIEASAISICQGQTVTFIALPTNGGEIPGYQWKLNGNNVGDNAETFSSNSLQNGDIVTVEMTTSVPCATSPTATSGPVTMTISSSAILYADLDGDGYGNATSGTIQACGTTKGYVTSNNDCDDNNSAVHPGATEICGNGIDDNCNGIADENCDTTSTLPVMTVRMYPAKEGDVGYTTLDVQVTLDKPAPLPVSVHYATSDEDATARLDYVATSGWLHIPAGSLSATIRLRIIGDLLPEKNERFTINYSDPVNVTFSAEPRSQVMIIDDDKGKINNPIAHIDKTAIEEQFLKIPNVAKRNQVWMIPQIGGYENEILIINAQGNLVSRFVNYQNHTPISNVAAGLYFYRIRILDGEGQVKYYSGRLLITE